MIALKIDVTKIDKSLLFRGKNGVYLDAVLVENRDGEDQYGNMGFISQSIPKERREAGERGPIIGNYKEVGKSQRKATPPAPKPKPKAQRDPDLDAEDEEIPF